MIDSIIWKEKLEQDVASLRKRLLQRRWSFKSMVLFERELMLIFFSIRALIEAGKLTDQTSHKEYKFMTYPNKGKVVDDYTKYYIDEVFDLDSGTENKLTLKLLTHQFIHAYVIFPDFSEEGNVAGVLLCSDWEKKNSLIKLPIDLAIEIIEDVIADKIKQMHIVRNEKTGELRKTKIL
ncbi:MAG: hypothetical protein O9324_27035 [Microcystis sp. LE19-84.1B]|jgi:hypothetical protein|uniref:GAF domain-containing protein n=1 Tax=Microcystis flos-aquae FACHB-1344 TaxID=2692899 RepID=A0ABR8HTR5_9CHRO|nr:MULTISPECIES: hypothetical protein [Microcystis]MBD2621949.1 hypothetical protein [Microcystis flos-aquae FACHB-1344]MCZ8191861.1 hypothetical protein [Microcystis sp. LE19-338.1B]MCZ8227488.1 hypothetical protein [Microcystis sp. LE19-84.1B]MCZ8356841.1 hypothetical protein [Microcystis sp. LE19-388.1G]